MTRRLLLVRHGEIDPQNGSRFLGRSDPPLGPIGRTQAEELGALVESFRPTRCLSSPLRRSVETAQRALGTTRVELELREELCEIDFGRWEGRPFADVQAEDPKLVSRWVADESSFAFPAGESVAGFRARVCAVLGLLESPRSSATVLFSHAGVIRSLLCHLLQIPLDRHRAFTVRCGAAAAVAEQNGAYALFGLNLRFPEQIAWPS